MPARTELLQQRIEGSDGLERFRVDDRTYTRDPAGRWSYGDTGVLVPGARDLLLRDLYVPGTLVNAKGEVEAIVIPVPDADGTVELGWCAGGASVVELGARRSYLIDRDEWERRASSRCGIWAPELHGTDPERLAACAERDFRLAQHRADLAARRRARAFHAAAEDGMTRRALASLVELSPSRIQQVTDASRSPDGFDPRNVEAQLVLEMVARAPHIEIAELDGDSEETRRSTRDSVETLLKAGLIAFGRTRDSLVLTAAGRDFIQTGRRSR
jgi:hypothetical protein